VASDALEQPVDVRQEAGPVAVVASPPLPLCDTITGRLADAGWSVAAAGGGAHLDLVPDLLCVVVDTTTAPQRGTAALSWTREKLTRLYADTKAVAGGMRGARRGAVVFVCTASSSAATAGVPGAVVLDAVKGFAWSLALELGGRGITVNVITASALQDDGGATALRRAGDPTDVADAVLFFATSATFVTGQMLEVSGGATVGRLAL
jgi:hypothetical protein